MSLSDRASCLVIDDEESICVLIHDFLADDGHHIFTARSKKEALDYLDTREFDLIITDKNLPDGNGLEIIAEVRRLKHQSEIIIITGYSDLDSAIEAFRYGVYRYIKKPFDLNALSIEVTGALRTHKIKNDLHSRTDELEQANADLIQSEMRFRELADLLPGIVIETDATGYLSFVNQTGLKTTGYDADTFETRFNNGSIVERSDRARWTEEIQKVLTGEIIDVSEFAIVCADEQVKPFIAQTTPRTSGETKAGLRGILMDISRHKKTESALREKETQLQLVQKMEAIGSLASGVAHDFNNMLGAIRGFCDLMLFDIEADSQIADDINSIIDATDRASELTRQLLVFGRKQILVPQVVNLNTIVLRMEKMIRRLVREDIHLETRLTEYPLHVHVDRSQIEQVIMNLIVNARDAMPDGGQLIIETMKISDDEDTQPFVQLSVRDTGHGMDDETISRVFEPFFTTKEKGKGTGLGLATVYGIIHQSNGTISINSAPGEGTQFIVQFPLSEETAAPAPSLSPQDSNLMGEGTILVVEDEAMLLQVVARILRSYGYTVITAPRVGDALLLCEKHTDPIDLLLVDVVMPQMNGAELTERLRQIHPEMKPLFMSGYSDFTVVRQVMEKNIDRFIAKPFSAQQLAEKIKEIRSQSDF